MGMFSNSICFCLWWFLFSLGLGMPRRLVNSWVMPFMLSKRAGNFPQTSWNTALIDSSEFTSASKQSLLRQENQKRSKVDDWHKNCEPETMVCECQRLNQKKKLSPMKTTQRIKIFTKAATTAEWLLRVELMP